jgi:hypothetical protein
MIVHVVCKTDAACKLHRVYMWPRHVNKIAAAAELGPIRESLLLENIQDCFHRYDFWLLDIVLLPMYYDRRYGIFIFSVQNKSLLSAEIWPLQKIFE